MFVEMLSGTLTNLQTNGEDRHLSILLRSFSSPHLNNEDIDMRK